jgi:hypothetical protein
MCEIAVCDPEQCGIAPMQQLAAKFHDEQGDGIGVLAVKNHGDKFTYETYRSTEPHWQTLYAFMNRHMDETWRFVIHGRYGTIGGTKREHCHPLSVECEACEFDHVIHNGSVRNYQQNKASLTSHGHDFATDVDSEVIPHKVSELPDTVSDHGYNTYNIKGKLNYLLFSEDGILVRAQRKYDLTDDFTMTCSRTDIENAEDLGFERAKNKWALITPDGATPEVETKSRKYSRSSGSSRQSQGQHYSQNGTQHRTTWPAGASQANDDEPDEEDRVIVAYDDLTPEYDKITVVQVAPGTLRMHNKHDDTVEYIERDIDPRLYYFYSTDETPDNIDHLEELAEANVLDGEQQSLSEYDEGNVEEAVETATANTLANVAEGDIRELQDRIVHNLDQATQRAATTGE